MSFVRPKFNLGYEPSVTEGVRTLPQAIEYNARFNGDRVFALQLHPQSQDKDELGRKITFADLAHGLDAAAEWLVERGVGGAEDKGGIAVLMGSDVGLFIWVAAGMRVGVPVLLLSARLTPVAIDHLLSKTEPNPKLVLTSPLTSRLTPSPAPNAPIWIEAPTYTELLSSPSASSVALPPHPLSNTTERTAIILHSSGTTGLPKPIYHAHGYVLGYGQDHLFTPKHVEALGWNVSTLPLYHGFGLLAPMLSLSIGLPFVLPGAGTIPTGRGQLKVLDALCADRHANGVKVNGTNGHLNGTAHTILNRVGLMLSVPSVVEDLLTIPGGVDALKRLDVLAVGGAPLKEVTGEELVHRGVKLLNHWGATEIGAIAVVQHVPANYDWHYLIPRQDIPLTFTPLGEGTYRLSGRAPGWEEDYVVQDHLVGNPAKENQYRILGRSDDLVVLANGEKVRPSGMEQALGECPGVRGVLVFGQGREGCGILVEVEGEPSADFDAFLDKANELADKHAKVAKEMVVFVSPGQLVRTDKGSIARKASWEKWEKEIVKSYENADQEEEPIMDADAGVWVARVLKEVLGYVIPETKDFFECGMDSLQAARIRRRIGRSLKVDLETDFVYRHSTARRLVSAIEEVRVGRYVSEGVRREEKMRQMLEKYRAEMLGSKVVLLTGSTGSLGCFLLARLAKDPEVKRVVCINRRGGRERQETEMKRRGAGVIDWYKIHMLEIPDLGDVDDQLDGVDDVTHIIHNAWPVNFSRGLDSFEGHVRGLVNLVKIAQRSSAKDVRVLFASSIAVVGQYPLQPVPEQPVPPESTAQFGYPEAKWVCEELLLSLEGKVRGSSVRIGQMTGAEGAGAWNESEHFPVVVGASKAVGALPRLEGTLSWLPVNRAGQIVIELLFSERFKPIYHMENPARQEWTAVIDNLADILGIPVLDYAEWLERVRGNEQVNKLIGFLERDFERMASGGVVLGTEEAKKDSRGMRESGVVGRKEVEEYVNYWRGVGVL
ncbi:acetyl-CoA synthetase-like protein [Armillaria solidipes]|uniref:Acetyl-CoA synthetase-like protein n=1 Tax=Armillaria solidipes TaxID=1076256 RepID=A0A2H3B044_9AGAR|nr:acetyl-CoA synthetase-like protein [Armillaria solidipes]